MFSTNFEHLATPGWPFGHMITQIDMKCKLCDVLHHHSVHFGIVSDQNWGATVEKITKIQGFDHFECVATPR